MPESRFTFMRFLKSPTSRKVITKSISASASVSASSVNRINIPSSATFLRTDASASIEASQATSAAVSELCKHFDVCLSEIDFDGDLSGERRRIERRLTVEAEKYINCALGKLNDAAQVGNGVKEWPFAKSEAELLSIAIKLSDTAYDNKRGPEEDGLKFEKKCYIPASVNGTTKATTFTIVTPANEQDEQEPYPLLVIAIKGSRSPADWMVNSNGTPRDVGDFFNLTHMAPPTTRAGTKGPDPIKAHSGFLHCAHALLPRVTLELQKHIRESNALNVLFTGHSAGGAVSSLLFTHFLSIAHREYKNIRFSLVTFGAPPVTSPNITPLLARHKSPNKGTFLAICNEFDPVPRADSEYIRALLDLHRSAYGLPPLPESDESTPYTGPTNNSLVAAPISPSTTLSERTPTEISLAPSTPPGSSIRRRVTSTGEWILPTPVLHPLGSLIVLKDKNTDEEGMDLYAYEVNAEEFEKLLFVKVGAHRRGVYLENIDRVRKGLINGKGGLSE